MRQKLQNKQKLKAKGSLPPSGLAMTASRPTPLPLSPLEKESSSALAFSFAQTPVSVLVYLIFDPHCDIELATEISRVEAKLATLS